MELEKRLETLIEYANLMIIADTPANKRKEVADDFALNIIRFFGTRNLKNIYGTEDIKEIQSQISDSIMGCYK